MDNLRNKIIAFCSCTKLIFGMECFPANTLHWWFSCNFSPIKNMNCIYSIKGSSRYLVSTWAFKNILFSWCHLSFTLEHTCDVVVQLFRHTYILFASVDTEILSFNSKSDVSSSGSTLHCLEIMRIELFSLYGSQVHTYNHICRT
jgi:hypothetical protein